MRHEHVEDGLLVRVQPAGARPGDALAQRPGQLATEVRVDHDGMDVAAAAYGGRVAEARRHRLDGTRQVALRLPDRRERLERAQRIGGADRPRPRRKVLRGEIAAADGAQVGIDVGRAHPSLAATVVDVPEQLLSRQLLAALHDPAQAPVPDAQGVLLAALPAKAEAQLFPGHRHVPPAQGGEAERGVLAGVLLVPDADEGDLEQPDDERQHLLPAQSRARERRVHAGADRGQCAAESDHA